MADLQAPPHEVHGIVPVETVELNYIRRVVELCGGNKLLAAQKLGISRQTLARKLAEPGA